MISESWAAKIAVDPTTGCWLWTGYLNEDGYAMVNAAEAKTLHRALYIRTNGPVPAGLELDHLCRVRHCVNPDHLEPVTHLENIRRSKHVLLTEQDVIAMRLSVERTEVWAERLNVSYVAAYQARVGISWRSVAVEAVPFPGSVGVRGRTECKSGHKYPAGNAYVLSNGAQRCAQCQASLKRQHPAERCHVCATEISRKNMARHVRTVHRHDVSEQRAEEARG